MNEFSGVKLALVNGSKVVGILRENNPDIMFSNCWDVAGGPRKGTESALQCAFREAYEECGLDLKPESIVWGQECKDRGCNEPGGLFMVSGITGQQVDQIKIGARGQSFKLYELSDFLKMDNVVPFVKKRLWHYLER